MRVLFADAFDTAHAERLTSDGHEVIYEPELTSARLPQRIPGVDVLVVRSTLVTADALEAGDRLAMVVRAGAGTNTIDTDTAARLGIFVCNVPGRNAVAVAELAMGLIIALDRNIPDAVADLRQGRWDKKRYSQARGLKGRTLAVIGVGAIGTAVAERAAAFGLVVRVDDHPRSPEIEARLDAVGAQRIPSGRLLEGTDIVSLHVPLTDSTRGMVNRAFLDRLPDGAWVINTSRGELVDEDALLDALDRREMRAGLDVFADEPSSPVAEYHSRLASHPRVYGTHHIGASTRQAQESVADGTIEVIRAFDQGHVVNCVNLETESLGETTLSVRHRDEVGVLSSVLDVIRRAELNVQDMHNRVFRGAQAAVATLAVDGTPDEAVVAEIAALPDVIAVSIRPTTRRDRASGASSPRPH